MGEELNLTYNINYIPGVSYITHEQALVVSRRTNMNEEDTKSRSLTSSVLSIGKKLTVNTKASEFDKFFKLVTQQFSAEEGYEEVGHALSNGTQLAHPPFDIHELNESYPIAHNPEIETLYGCNENQWSKFRLSRLKEVQKE